MGKFTGVECLICKETFKDSDDIVVCPECGTPYHRECYAKEGKCINEKLHEENKSWTEENDKFGSGSMKKCPKCNAENKPHSFICENCGSSLINNLDFENQGNNANIGNQGLGGGYAFNPYDKYLGMDPEEKLDDEITVAEAAEFVDSNTPYYLMVFKRMKDTGKKIAVSLVCAFFAEFYFAYRKMWAEAFVVAILKILLAVPEMISWLPYMAENLEQSGMDATFLNNAMKVFDYESTSFMLAVSIASYATLAVNLLCFLFGNWFYYRHMRKKVSVIKMTYSSKTEIDEKIKTSGGTSILGIVLIAVLNIIFAAAFVFALQLFK